MQVLDITSSDRCAGIIIGLFGLLFAVVVFNGEAVVLGGDTNSVERFDQVT